MKQNKSNHHELPKASDEKQTKGVKTLQGDPKKAIITLAVPMIIAMLVQTIYNLTDAIWVSFLGSDALAAVGFVFPFFIMVIALSTGMGVGAGSAISRRIGAKDKVGADSVAEHSIILVIIIALIFTIPLYFLAEPIFKSLGAGGVIDYTVSYGKIIFAGSIVIFFSNIANAILRGEGDAKRAMYAMALGSVLNIVLDPIFIDVLDLGVAGAAWATIFSICITSILLLYWLLFKKNTYVKFKFKDFKPDKKIIKDIFGVGLPASVSQLSMSISMILLNFIIILVMLGDNTGVAIFSTGWRVITIAILPLIGIATAVVSVSGAAYGAKSYDKLNISHLYAVKIGLVIETIIAVVIFILAPQIALVFSQFEGSTYFTGELITFLRIMVIFFPCVSLGMLSSAAFQGVNKGVNALIGTVLRSIVFTIIFVVLFAYVLQMDLIGVWLGIVFANAIGSTIIFTWARLYIRNLMKKPELG
jgi:putative MATE family efflux protein